MAEHSNRTDRGRALGLGFGTLWPLGAIAATLLNLALDSAGVSHDLQWRIVLAAAAVPALSILYFRRRMPETVRYLARLGSDQHAAIRVIREISGEESSAPPTDNRPFLEVLASHARLILSAALLWMIFDLVVYASVPFGPSLIARGLGLTPVHFLLLIEFVFTLPASLLLAWFVIDSVGRKPLQVWGFSLSAALLVVFAAINVNTGASPEPSLIVFGLFNVAVTGPGLVSGAGVFGVELSPTRIRSVAQSITVAGGRIGTLLTQMLVLETSRRSLEEINLETLPNGGMPVVVSVGVEG